MAALRAVSPASAPAQWQDVPAPLYVDDRNSMGEAVLRLVELSDRPHADAKDELPAFGKAPPPPRKSRGWRYDLAIRLTGLCAIAFASGLILWLYRLIHAAPGADGTLGQYAIGAVALLNASLGMGLLLLGRHIHDRVPISERWRQRF